MERSKYFPFELRSPDKLWFSGEASAVKFSTESGEMMILPGHISLVGNIDFTAVRIERDDHVEEYLVRYGTVIIDDIGGGARILAQDIQTYANMDIKSLSEYLHFLTEQLNNEGLTSYQVQYLGEQRGILEKSIAVLESQNAKK